MPSKRNRRNNNRSKAFTLLEILLGLVIFSVIALSLYTVFSSGIRLNRRAEQINGLYREARWIFSQLAKDMENAVEYNFSRSYKDLTPFQGTNERLSLIVATPTGLKAVSYYLFVPEEGSIHKVIIGKKTKKNVSIVTREAQEQKIYSLAREEIPLVDFLSTNKGEEKDIEILSTRIRENGLNFQYAGEGEGTQKRLVWQSEWGKVNFPYGVQVALTFVKTNEKDSDLKLSENIMIPKTLWNRKEIQ